MRTQLCTREMFIYFYFFPLMYASYIAPVYEFVYLQLWRGYMPLFATSMNY